MPAVYVNVCTAVYHFSLRIFQWKSKVGSCRYRRKTFTFLSLSSDWLKRVQWHFLITVWRQWLWSKRWTYWKDRNILWKTTQHKLVLQLTNIFPTLGIMYSYHHIGTSFGFSPRPWLYCTAENGGSSWHLHYCGQIAFSHAKVSLTFSVLTFWSTDFKFVKFPWAEKSVLKISDFIIIYCLRAEQEVTGRASWRNTMVHIQRATITRKYTCKIQNLLVRWTIPIVQLCLYLVSNFSL